MIHVFKYIKYTVKVTATRVFFSILYIYYNIIYMQSLHLP